MQLGSWSCGASFAVTAVLALGCSGSDSETNSSSSGSGGNAASSTHATTSATTGGGHHHQTTAGGGGAGGEGGGGPFMTAPHTPLQMMNHGGGVYATPALITITFSTFDRTDYVQAFGDYLVTSSYFTTAMAEYGVGAGVHLAKVVLPDTPPPDDQSLTDLLRQHIMDGTLPSPIDNPQAVYMVYFPKGSTFSDQGKICDVFDGYHALTKFMDTRFVYAIIGECDGMINTASHELAESATDPTIGGWYIDGPTDDPSYWVTDDEIADLCEYYPSVTIDSYPVARLWSNKASVANQDPCQPTPPNDPPSRNVFSTPATIPKVTRGQSQVFQLTGYSSAPSPPWKLHTEHATYYPNYKGSFKAQIALSQNTIQNGETIQLTLTVPTDATVGTLGMVGIASDDLYAEEFFIGVVAQ